MDTRSLAHPAPTTTRLERGAELYREHFERFSYAGGGVFVVPGGSALALTYEVTLREGVERCECADHSAPRRSVQAHHRRAHLQGEDRGVRGVRGAASPSGHVRGRGGSSHVLRGRRAVSPVRPPSRRPLKRRRRADLAMSDKARGPILPLGGGRGKEERWTGACLRRSWC